MTRDDAFIRQLEAYLDEFEGPTPLPESVRATVRAALPRTKQISTHRGPRRYLTIMSKTAAVAVATAAALALIAVGALLLTRPNVGDGTPESVAPSVVQSAAPTASGEACSATTASASGLAGRTIDVAWCVSRESGANEFHAFTMQGDASWIDQHFGDVNALWLAPADGGRIAFVLVPGETVDELTEEIGARTGYAVTEPTAVEIAGDPGVVFDVALAEGVSSGEVEPLVETSGQNWTLAADSSARVWIIDRGDESLMIITGDALADAVGDALDTLAWVD